MGFFSGISAKLKQAKGHVQISNILCGRSWMLITDDGSTVTYVFKSDGSLLVTRNGLITPISWDFRTENNTLHITDEKGIGFAFAVKVIQEDILISLVQVASIDNIMFLSNESVSNSPKTLAEVEDIIVANKVNQLLSIANQYRIMLHSNHTSSEQTLFSSQFCTNIDSVLEGVQGDILVRIIDKAKQESKEIEAQVSLAYAKRRAEKERNEELQTLMKKADAARKIKKIKEEKGEVSFTDLLSFDVLPDEYDIFKKPKHDDSLLLNPLLSSFSACSKKIEEYIDY